MKKCQKCGAENKDDVLYCSKCGNKLDSVSVPLTPTKPVKVWTVYETLTIISCFLAFTEILAPVGLSFSILGIIRSKKLRGLAIASTAVGALATFLLIAALYQAAFYQLKGTIL
jgi:hypothetical protein